MSMKKLKLNFSEAKHFGVNEIISYLTELEKMVKLREDSLRERIILLAKIVDKKIPYRDGHSIRVSIFSKEIAKRLHLNKKDIFVDLGCGTAEMLVEASRKVKKAIGIEIDPLRFLVAKLRTRKLSNVKVLRGNLFKIPVEGNKIFVFLSKEANEKLGKRLSKLKNAMVVSYKWPLKNLRLIEKDDKERLFLYSTA